jgi:ATP-dependent DNA helicase RecQ
MSIHEILKQYWGYTGFRPLQEDIIHSVLDGNDTLALMPTGGGKSICFQVPALAREGICIVVSPLIALMKDQVEQLQKRNISAVAIYSGMTRREIDLHLDNCVYGNIKFLYVSPERLQTEILIERVKRMQVGLLAVDEAHCISQWGYDFRPSYLEIAQFREIIPDIALIALTATATNRVKQDIQDRLVFRKGSVFQKSFARPNLSYSVFYEEDKEKKLLQILQSVKGSAIVYVRSRKRTQAIAKYLYRHGISTSFYHAGLSNEDRSKRQEEWIQGQIRVIVATNAFGMGIDKPDVRLVVHMDVPDNLEAYYQEAGRAGRDEQKAYAVLLYTQKDIGDLRRRLQQSYPSIDMLRRVYQCLANYFKVAVGSSQLTSYDFDINDFVKTFQLPLVETFYAIKRLEEEGFIQLNEDFYHPSKLLICINHTELYKFQVANAALDGLTKAILRMYGGEILSGYSAISESKLATFLSTSVNDVMRKLKHMHQMEVVDYDPQKDTPQLLFLTARIDAPKLPLDKKKLEERYKVQAEKIDKIIHYATHTHRCRTQLLQEYFGEVTYDRCRVCDVCLQQKAKGDTEISEIKVIRQKIRNLLNKTSLIPQQLSQQIGGKEEVISEAIRMMLDAQEVQYDKEGRLFLKK